MSEYAVVTGATGALGSAIVASLRSAGLTVVALFGIRTGRPC